MVGYGALQLVRLVFHNMPQIMVWVCQMEAMLSLQVTAWNAVVLKEVESNLLFLPCNIVQEIFFL